MDTMKAVAFLGEGRLGIEERPKPSPRAGQAVVRITTTTICGTDVHIVKGEYPVRKGLVLGHEPVGVIDALGEGLEPEYHVGQRVIVGAITPCGQCFYCLNGVHSQCGGPLGWLAVRQHDRRRVGRVSARAGRAREPCADSRRADRRAGRARARHLLDRAERRREREHQGRRRRRRLRAGSDRPVRDARRQASRRGAHHRHRLGARTPGDGQALRRRRRHQPPSNRIRSPRSSG